MLTLKILKQTSEKLILQIQPQRAERIWRTGFAAFWMALFSIFYVNSVGNPGASHLAGPPLKAEQGKGESVQSIDLGRIQPSPVGVTPEIKLRAEGWLHLILIFGSGLWIFAPAVCAVRLEFDPSSNRLSYRWRHLLGRQSKHYALNQLEQVELRSYWDSDEEELCYLPMLVFKGHAPLVLWEDWDAQAGEKVVARIERFLDRQEMSRVE